MENLNEIKEIKEEVKQTRNLLKALLNAQKEIKNAEKDKVNSHFKSRYATLEAVLGATKEVLNKNDILILQEAGHDGSKFFVGTSLFHVPSGEEFSSKIPLLIGSSNMQQLGSAITYARKYSLASLLCIGQEDDDGNSVSIENKDEIPF